jgi:hypothetical protein
MSADQLAELRSRLAAARAAGDSASEAQLLQDAAVLHASMGQTEEAKKRLRSAVDLLLAQDRAQDAANAEYSFGVLEARNPARAAQARESFRRAADGFEDPHWRGRALAQLGDVELQRADIPAAAIAFGHAADAFRAAGDAAAEADAMRRLAQALLLAGREQEAAQVLARAVDEALAGGLAETAVGLRLDRRAILGPGADETDSLGAIITDARRQDRPDLAARAYLARAGERAQRGDLAGALDDADSSRANALEAIDPITYTMACLQLAELHELRGDRIAAVGALVKCQASLGELLGDEARAPVIAVLEAQEARWGQEAFDEALERFKARNP